jgi:hypothetical protein
LASSHPDDDDSSGPSSSRRCCEARRAGESSGVGIGGAAGAAAGAAAVESPRDTISSLPLTFRRPCGRRSANDGGASAPAEEEATTITATPTRNPTTETPGTAILRVFFDLISRRGTGGFPEETASAPAAADRWGKSRNLISSSSSAGSLPSFVTVISFPYL